MAMQGPKKVLWLSRHRPGQAQMAEARRVWGDDVIVQVDDRPLINDPARSAEDVRSRMAAGQFDELVVVAPLGLIEQLCATSSQTGWSPIWPRMSQDRRTFLGFDRITAIRKEKREVTPEPDSKGAKVLWLSRFPPHASQIAGLRETFGTSVVVNHRDIRNVDDAADEFHHGGYRAIVAVVPEAVFELLTEMELSLLRSEAIVENDPSKVEFRGAGGQGFRFDRFVWYGLFQETSRL